VSTDYKLLGISKRPERLRACITEYFTSNKFANTASSDACQFVRSSVSTFLIQPNA